MPTMPGLLDSLLGSVYTAADVSFTRDEMRAGIDGDSTVDKASGGATVVAELETKLAEPSQGESDRRRRFPRSRAGRSRRR